jgi:hypothetical protein
MIEKKLYVSQGCGLWDKKCMPIYDEGVIVNSRLAFGHISAFLTSDQIEVNLTMNGIRQKPCLDYTFTVCLVT